MRDRQGTDQSSGPCMLQYLEIRKWRISTSGQHDVGLKKKKRKTLRERWPKATKRKYFMKRDLSLHQILSTCQVRWEPRTNHKIRQFEGPSGCWKGLLEWSGLGDNLIGIDFRMTWRRGSRDWLWTNCLRSCVVKERKKVKGHLERVMKGKFYKSG